MDFSKECLDLNKYKTVSINCNPVEVKKSIYEYETIKDLDLKGLKLKKNLLNILPEYICKKHNILPLKLYDEEIYIASSIVLGEVVLEQLRFLTGKSIKIILWNREEINCAIKRFYNNYNNRYSIRETKEEDKLYEEKKKEEKLEGPIIKLTDSIIEEAIWRKASDIHIEPFKDFALIRFRVDGILCEFNKISKKVYTSICTRIKIISYMNIAEKKIPQDGKIQNNYRENHDFRVSTLPTVYGEKVVIRILYKNETISDLQSLGFLRKHRENIETMIRKPNGLILVTGPTGSGKSTTIYSMLKYINNKEKNIITIEEPVEYTISGINQVNVNYKRDLTFLNGLKSILRQDPDVIMVGEIRDEETAKVAVRAAITGHLVLTTLHTNGALESITRLLDMNIEPYILSDGLKGIISQRLIRKLCPHCRESYVSSKEEMKFMNIKKEVLLYKEKGCDKCNNTGYKGRTIIYEYINIDKEKRSIIKDIVKCNNYQNTLLVNSLKENINEVLEEGITSFKEVQRIL